MKDQNFENTPDHFSLKMKYARVITPMFFTIPSLPVLLMNFYLTVVVLLLIVLQSDCTLPVVGDEVDLNYNGTAASVHKEQAEHQQTEFHYHTLGLDLEEPEKHTMSDSHRAAVRMKRDRAINDEDPGYRNDPFDKTDINHVPDDYDYLAGYDDSDDHSRDRVRGKTDDVWSHQPVKRLPTDLGYDKATELNLASKGEEREEPESFMASKWQRAKRLPAMLSNSYHNQMQPKMQWTHGENFVVRPQGEGIPLYDVKQVPDFPGPGNGGRADTDIGKHTGSVPEKTPQQLSDAEQTKPRYGPGKRYEWLAPRKDYPISFENLDRGYQQAAPVEVLEETNADMSFNGHQRSESLNKNANEGWEYHESGRQNADQEQSQGQFLAEGNDLGDQETVNEPVMKYFDTSKDMLNKNTYDALNAKNDVEDNEASRLASLLDRQAIQEANSGMEWPDPEESQLQDKADHGAPGQILKVSDVGTRFHSDGAGSNLPNLLKEDEWRKRTAREEMSHGGGALRLHQSSSRKEAITGKQSSTIREKRAGGNPPVDPAVPSPLLYYSTDIKNGDSLQPYTLYYPIVYRRGNQEVLQYLPVPNSRFQYYDPDTLDNQEWSNPISAVDHQSDSDLLSHLSNLSPMSSYQQENSNHEMQKKEASQQDVLSPDTKKHDPSLHRQIASANKDYHQLQQHLSRSSGLANRPPSHNSASNVALNHRNNYISAAKLSWGHGQREYNDKRFPKLRKPLQHEASKYKYYVPDQDASSEGLRIHNSVKKSLENSLSKEFFQRSKRSAGNNNVIQQENDLAKQVMMSKVNSSTELASAPEVLQKLSHNHSISFADGLKKPAKQHLQHPVFPLRIMLQEPIGIESELREIPTRFKVLTLWWQQATESRDANPQWLMRILGGDTHDDQPFDNSLI